MAVPAPTPVASFDVRELDPLTDAGAYLALRQFSLVESPGAYWASPSEGARETEDDAVAFLSRERHLGGVVLGAWSVGPNPRLLGMVRLGRLPWAKVSHRGTVRALYVHPEARGRGLGRHLIEHCLARAEAWGLDHVAIEVIEGNAAARRLYEAIGFCFSHRVPRMFCHKGRFLAEEVLVYPLSPGARRQFAAEV